LARCRAVELGGAGEGPGEAAHRPHGARRGASGSGGRGEGESALNRAEPRMVRRAAITLLLATALVIGALLASACASTSTPSPSTAPPAPRAVSPPPAGLAAEQVPQFVVLGFDDNGISGMAG